MSEPSTREMLEFVQKWQNSPYVHPLTCGVDSNHAELVPVEEGEAIKLVCPNCNYTQDLPKFMYEFYKDSVTKENSVFDL